ncbi:hypothetical protein CLIB1444_10S01596 [[Candida] jaroonii]|uniref:Uncharacterized protein n=1 Tax=[Candida] jaroonii TaxID=467808 RepID=A0ACA9YBZ2_9ASCO|nr:hypothetical protein CLIB1444_10S01596 [[Candida] jaroonii]
MKTIWTFLTLVLTAPLTITVKHTNIVTITGCECVASCKNNGYVRGFSFASTETSLPTGNSMGMSTMKSNLVGLIPPKVTSIDHKIPTVTQVTTVVSDVPVSYSTTYSSFTPLFAPKGLSSDPPVVSTEAETSELNHSSTSTQIFTSTTDEHPIETMNTQSDTLPSNVLEKMSIVYSNFSGHFSNSSEKFWSRFWNDGKFNAQDQICVGHSFTEPSVWELAVVSRAIVFSGNTDKTNKMLSSLYEYENKNLKVFSASTAGDGDIYNDDNGQIAWSFIDGYKLTGEDKYLNSAKGIVNFLMQQTDANGGVYWHYGQNYIASISTSEAALAAMRLFEITKDDKLLTFARNCTEFMFTYFQDPNDKLFYDGLDSNDYNNLNKGKLTYTVGVTLSTLSLLHKYDTSGSWMPKIIQLTDAALNSTGAFYNGDGIWNNAMRYSHLLFTGLNDVLQLNLHQYKPSILKQGNFIIDYLQDTDELFFDSIGSCTSSMIGRYKKIFDENVNSKDIKFCNNVATKSLMDNGSVLQILFQMSRNF